MAKASARPMTMQLVMMSPTKTESCFDTSKRNVGLEDLVGHDHQRGDDGQLDDDADARGNPVADDRYDSLTFDNVPCTPR